jgi:hypothetical protein
VRRGLNLWMKRPIRNNGCGCPALKTHRQLTKYVRNRPSEA